MKHRFLTLLVAVAANIGTTFAWYDKVVQIGDLYYYLRANTQTAGVKGYSDSISSDIIIPASVEYNSVTYSVTYIESSAFNGCSIMTSVTIPNSVTSIGGSAFRDCSGLTSVTIPNSVTSIGDEAFYGCSSLTSIEIPNSVKTIEDWVFRDCRSLVSVTLPDSITSIGKYSFSNCRSLTSIEIPKSVTSIGNYAFNECVSLDSIEIPNSVTSIEKYAFYQCSTLVSIKIPQSITIIENSVFRFCTSLSSVEIPNSVAIIEEWAFSGCNSLTSIDIPSSVKSINGTNVFNCRSLISINVASDNPNYSSIDGVLFNKAKNVLIKFPPLANNTYTIPKGVTSIGVGAFQSSAGLTSVTIPNSVTSIGDGAFQHCSGLTSIEIPNRVTSIGNGAFFDCTGLTSITCSASRPPTCSSSSSVGNNTSIPLYVPVGSINLYKTANVWKNFTNILPICEPNDTTFYNTICGSEPIQWRGKWIETDSQNDTIREGKYIIERYCRKDTVLYDTLVNITACDSIIKYYVKYSPEYSVSVWDTVLEGTVLIGNPGTNYSYYITATLGENIYYNDTLRTKYYGCDSIIFHRVTVLPIPQYSVSLAVNEAEWGSVVGNGTYKQDSSVIISAFANYGYTFSLWSDGVTDNPRTVVITQDTTITAIFTINHYPVVLLGHDGKLLSKQSVAYNHAAEVPEIPVREGYTFAGWTTDIEHITDTTYAIAVYDKIGGTVIYKAEDGEIIGSENVDLHLPAAPMISGKTFAGWLTESVDSESGIVLRATYTTDNPTTHDDVSVVPGSTTAAVNFPYITGALTYELVIRDLFGHVVCKIMFNSTGHLLGIALAPGRNRTAAPAQTDGFNFTVEGLDPNTTYNYEFVAHDDTDEVIETLSGSFTTTDDTPTGVENVQSNNVQCTKELRNDHVYILRGDKTYTITGQEVK